MPETITPISLRSLFRVNCYLVAGCETGSLRLMILTHGHTDRAGNCAHLRKAYGAPIAMHAADVGKVACGDMFRSPDGGRALATTVAKTTLALIGLGKFEAFPIGLL